jgi:hypothetical protein
VSRPGVDDVQQAKLVREADALEHAADHLRPSLDSNGAQDVHLSPLQASEAHHRSQIRRLPRTTITGTRTTPSLKYYSDETSSPFRRRMRSQSMVASDPTVVTLGPRSQPRTLA